ncbi:hypothetical protein BO99DRAFT_130793 [Aspergillus violaceofuscus CBS 115571]|uniref:Uncharacterized protein n=1 Tax=Aspergillus violaceofuscus (strain CBS 115571) TaxID=1450538 RepID=A0A2V5HDF7_ASPV1|nr:hypothetical protein BO99DRAFT_130793 [Aspergillus violaceofuscus CBS 115571]
MHTETQTPSVPPALQHEDSAPSQPKSYRNSRTTTGCHRTLASPRMIGPLPALLDDRLIRTIGRLYRGCVIGAVTLLEVEEENHGCFLPLHSSNLIDVNFNSREQRTTFEPGASSPRPRLDLLLAIALIRPGRLRTYSAHSMDEQHRQWYSQTYFSRDEVIAIGVLPMYHVAVVPKSLHH